jgi:hypothetical protein
VGDDSLDVTTHGGISIDEHRIASVGTELDD